MLEHADWFIVFIGAVAITVALLSLGMVCGYRLGMRAGARLIAPPENAAPPSIHEAIDDCREASSNVAEKMRALMEHLSASRQAIPPALHQAIDELVSATKLLRQQLEKVARTVLSSQSAAEATNSPFDRDDRPVAGLTGAGPRSCQTVAGPSNSDRLTGDELQSLTMLAGEPHATETDSAKRRYSYDCMQSVYPWPEDDAQGAIGPGMSVRCHDISGHGISFFWADSPPFERLIISLGACATPVYVAAEVVQSKAVYMHGDVCYLVGCRFTGRVPEFSESNRIQFNRRRIGKVACEPELAI
jgi:hypothetical protein